MRTRISTSILNHQRIVKCTLQLRKKIIFADFHIFRLRVFLFCGEFINSTYIARRRIMKVLVSDNLNDIGIKMFEEEDGIDVDVNVGLSSEELKSIIGDYDALVIRSATKVTEDLLAAATRLKVVGRAGIGLDNVDIPAATKRGVIVMNTPEGNIVTTAEHSIAMLLSMSRNIPLGTDTLKAGKWEKKNLQGREIFNKVLGVIGFGRIGSIVADRARGLRMRVIVTILLSRPSVSKRKALKMYPWKSCIGDPITSPFTSPS